MNTIFRKVGRFSGKKHRKTSESCETVRFLWKISAKNLLSSKFCEVSFWRNLDSWRSAALSQQQTLKIRAGKCKKLCFFCFCPTFPTLKKTEVFSSFGQIIFCLSSMLPPWDCDKILKFPKERLRVSWKSPGFRKNTEKKSELRVLSTAENFGKVADFSGDFCKKKFVELLEKSRIRVDVPQRQIQRFHAGKNAYDCAETKVCNPLRF